MEQTEITTSPLNNVNPQSLDELFAQDPLSLSNQDLDKIVNALRIQRKTFVEEDLKSGKTGKRVSSAAAKAAAASITLESLNLKI